MLGFPVPYPDELLYSTVARGGIQLGTCSPKQLLDEVFGDRKVVATIDLPCHLDQMASLYPDCLGLNSEALAYRHTLFPIYAPFITEDRRRVVLQKLCAESQGAIHLALGIAASRVKQARTIRYCPGCMAQQLEEHGEYFWLRSWQVIGADSCAKHGALVDAEVPRHMVHRHQFIAATPNLCPQRVQQVATGQSEIITKKVEELLNIGPRFSPTFGQWSQYYFSLIEGSGFVRGRHHIDYGKVVPTIVNHWSDRWLRKMGIAVTDEQSCWLRGILRKHRKSFCYLEHIVVLDAFLPEGWLFEQVLDSVCRLSMSKSSNDDFGLVEEPVARVHSAHRAQWLSQVRQEGTKLARSHGGGANYAWLYRHDRNWLLKVNRRFQADHPSNICRVDWEDRDRKTVRRLLSIRKQHEDRLADPRWSRNWFLSKLDNASTVEKSLNKLPLSRLFFLRYCEEVSDYQIRRITLAICHLYKDNQTVKRWKVLRGAGLSEERLTARAREILDWAISRYE